MRSVLVGNRRYPRRAWQLIEPNERDNEDRQSDPRENRSRSAHRFNCNTSAAGCATDFVRSQLAVADRTLVAAFQQRRLD